MLASEEIEVLNILQCSSLAVQFFSSAVLQPRCKIKAATGCWKVVTGSAGTRQTGPTLDEVGLTRRQQH